MSALITSTMTESYANKIPQLEGRANFKIWKNLMKMALIGRGDWPFVNPIGARARKPIKLDGDSDDMFEARLSQWEVATNRAALFIVLNCSPAIQEVVSDFGSAREVWTCLDRHYGPFGPETAAAVEDRLRDLAYDGNNIEIYCMRYEQVVRELDVLGRKPAPEALICDFINHVSKFYPNWTEHEYYELGEGDFPSLDTVVNRLLTWTKG